MRSRALPFLYGAVLLIGIVIGSVCDPCSSSTVQANALNPAESDRLYSELGSNGSTLIDSGRNLAKIAAVTTPSVVHIESTRLGAGSHQTIEETGSGVLITGPNATGTCVVTNRHVVAGAPRENIQIRLYDGRVLNPDRIWHDAASDVAVMKVSAPNLQPARWGNSDEVEIGHLVLAMGSPFGLSQSVTLGIVSAKGRRSLELGRRPETLINRDFLQTDAAINPGNSGGPLVDMRGRVIGINTAIASNSGGYQGIGFSIPSRLVRLVVDELLQHNRVRRAYLGVILDNTFNTSVAERLQLDRVRGARITEVKHETPASRSNLRRDDVILSFDGIDVQDENHLINLVSLSTVGKRVRLVVWRGGKELAVDVVLNDRPPDEQLSEMSTEPGMGVRIEPMGLTLHRMDRDISAQMGLGDATRGLLVLRVDPQSPLAAELELYDLIEEVSRTPVASLTELDHVLDATSANETVLLKIKRLVDGQPQTQIVVWRQH